MPIRTFEDLFARHCTVRTSAPGRVNLIGEHTDYNGGWVLPAAIPQRTSVEAAPRPDRTVRLWSAQFSDAPVAAYRLGEERPDGGWTDYAKGLTALLAAAHARMDGFDARIESRVPVGGGLSSSAALAIALGRALREMFDLDMDDVALALAARRAENDFVGAPVGIMDPMACSLADAATALLIDTRTLHYERVRLPPSCALIVIDSGLAHRHAGGAYAQRRSECAAAAEALGVPQLRDVGLDIAGRIASLPAPLDRRARHVVTENQRVLDTVRALQTGDLRAAGRLFVASHASMRDEFEVSVPFIDTLVEIACATPGVYGARLTGGGFGGAIVALAAVAQAREAAMAIVDEYEAATGLKGAVLAPA
jgi:galactokinase